MVFAGLSHNYQRWSRPNFWRINNRHRDRKFYMNRAWAHVRISDGMAHPAQIRPEFTKTAEFYMFFNQSLNSHLGSLWTTHSLMFWCGTLAVSSNRGLCCSTHCDMGSALLSSGDATSVNFRDTSSLNTCVPRTFIIFPKTCFSSFSRAELLIYSLL